jgi:hypothetical protein
MNADKRIYAAPEMTEGRDVTNSTLGGSGNTSESQKPFVKAP